MRLYIQRPWLWGVGASMLAAPAFAVVPACLNRAFANDKTAGTAGTRITLLAFSQRSARSWLSIASDATGPTRRHAKESSASISRTKPSPTATAST